MDSIIIYGLVYSMTLALTAIGLSLTFGISGVANFAIGGLYVLAGYLPWLFISNFGIPYPVAVVMSLLISAIIGALIYQLILQRVRGYLLAEVIGTFAIGIAILETIRASGLVGFGAKIPPFIQGTTMLLGVPIDFQRIFIVLTALILIGGLWLFTRRTKVGLAFRGIAQNERTALAFGIESDRIAMLSLVAGSVLIAIAAITILPLGLIHVDNGYEVLIIAIAVGIVGGLESLPGIILASFILGFSQTLAAMFIGTHWIMVVFLAAIVIVLALRPSGLLGRFKEIEERV
ncbi:MAG: branched-chain amino acid ABC transporter permease [Chloroflexota bacterium]